MIRSLLRPLSWPRRSIVHLAIVAVLPLTALAYWQMTRVRNGGEGSRNGPPAAEVSADRRIDTLAKPEASPTGPKHPSPDFLRSTALERLHSEATSRFVRAPGNGVGRIGQLGGQLGQISQLGSLGRIGTVQQQMPSFPTVLVRDWTIPAWSSSELSEEKRVEGAEDLDIIHKQSLTDFSKDESLETIPQSGPRKTRSWEVKSIDLVGLLMHDQPVVYVSEKLKMSELKQVPTRELDSFERAGLEKLQSGKDVFARGQNETIRMLGSVRAQKQCLTCHDVSEGKLLGAFSYTLRIAQFR